jgi:hypothetical protein
MIRAYCFASGHIDFGHGYRTRRVRGRLTKIKGPDILLVPGVPEAPNQIAAVAALQQWSKWIATMAPMGVRVLSS